jgi:site-specific recombinase XerD
MGLPAEEVQKIFNPMNQITARKPKQKVPYSLTTTEMAWILTIPMPTRDRTLINLILDTGIRISEALNLCHGDIRDEYITVDGKTGQREIPISQEVRGQLHALGSRGKVFKSYKGDLKYDGAYKIIRTILQRAGIQAKKWGPHTIRHTFGRQYIAGGGDLVSLQRLMGHTNIATTRIYAELDLRDITAQHTKYTPLRAAQRSAQGLLFATASRVEIRPETKN